MAVTVTRHWQTAAAAIHSGRENSYFEPACTSLPSRVSSIAPRLPETRQNIDRPVADAVSEQGSTAVVITRRWKRVRNCKRVIVIFFDHVLRTDKANSSRKCLEYGNF